MRWYLFIIVSMILSCESGLQVGNRIPAFDKSAVDNSSALCESLKFVPSEPNPGDDVVVTLPDATKYAILAVSTPSGLEATPKQTGSDLVLTIEAVPQGQLSLRVNNGPGEKTCAINIGDVAAVASSGNSSTSSGGSNANCSCVGKPCGADDGCGNLCAGHRRNETGSSSECRGKYCGCGAPDGTNYDIPGKAFNTECVIEDGAAKCLVRCECDCGPPATFEPSLLDGKDFAGACQIYKEQFLRDQLGLSFWNECPSNDIVDGPDVDCRVCSDCPYYRECSDKPSKGPRDACKHCCDDLGGGADACNKGNYTGPLCGE